MADKNWWEEEYSSKANPGNWWENDYNSVSSTVSKKITDSVNSWLQSHKNYVTNYQYRTKDRKYNYEDAYVQDSYNWMATVSRQKQDFDKSAESILAYMDQYKGYLDADFVKSVQDTLTSARGQQDIVVGNAKADSKWWSNFADEDEYKTAQRYDGYTKKYTGQKYDDIQKALSLLDDGEEKDWLIGTQHELYKTDRNYTSKALSGLKSFEAQKEVERKQEEDKTWWERIAENYANSSPDTSLPAANLSIVTAGYRNDTSWREPSDKWSDGQKRQFGYLYAEDPNKAYDYAEQLNNYYNAQEKDVQQKAIGAWAGQNFGTGTAGTLGAVATAPMALADVLDDLAEYAGRGTITQKGGLSPYEMGQAAQSGVAAKLNEMSGTIKDDVLVFGGKGLGDLYNLGVSTVNSIASSKLGSVGTLVNFFGQGAASGVDDALARGANAEQALLYGGVMGALEGITEKMSVDKLLKVGSASTFKNWFVNSLNQGLGELQEEGLSSLFGNIADNIIMGDKSNFHATVKELMDADPNLSEEDAKTAAWKKMAGDIAFDAIGGFFSGTVSGGYQGAKSTIKDSLKSNQQNIDAVKQYGERTDALIQEGLQNDQKSESYKLAQKYQKQTQGTEKKSGKAMTGFQIRNLLAANQAEVTKADLQKIQSTAEKRLVALGQKEDVSKIAELATKYATGGELSRAEKSFLTRTQNGSQVTSELLNSLQGVSSDSLLSKWENDMSEGWGDNYSTEWAEGIETKAVRNVAQAKKMVRAFLDAAANMPVEDPAAYKSLTERTGTDSRFGVSESGQATIRATGKAFDFENAEVAEVGNGQMSFKREDGGKVSAGGIDFVDDNQSFLVSAVSDIENITPAAATEVMHKIVDMSKPLGEQLNGIDEAFTYGRSGYSVEDLKAGNFVGNLTEEQMMRAYELGQEARKENKTSNTESIKKMRTAAQAMAEKAAAEGKEAPKAKKLSITYNHGGGVIEDIETARKKLGKLSKEQRAGMEAANILHQMGIGTDFKLFTSYYSKTLKDKDGKALEVFLNDEGQEQAAYAGVYMDANGKIRINLNAYSGTRGLTLNALSHELTHFIKDWSPEKYEAMADFLVKAYGEHGVSMHKLVLKEQARLEGIRGKEVSYSEAYDEVVANAFNRMLEDGKVMERIAEIRQVDKSLADKIISGIRKFIKRFMKVYKDNQSLFLETEALMEMKEVFEELQEMFAEALVDASDSFQASLIAQETEAVKSLGENAKVETNAAGELLLAANESGNVLMYSENTYLNGGREKLEMALRQNGHTVAEIQETLSYVDDALDYIKILAAGYAKNMGYTNLSDHLIADIVTNVKTGKQVMSAIVNNGDYPVNIDLSLICKKRVAYMNLMSRLIRDGVFDKVNYDGAAIAEVNEILRENGFETACLGCFVESRRLQFQTWAETIVSEWNAEVEKRNPNAQSFGFAKGKMEALTDADINALTRELESVKKNDQGNVNLGQGNSVTRMGRLLDALPSLQKKLTVEDLLTPEGLTALRKHDGSLFSIVKSRYGAASPKIVQDFNPYASEIAMLTFAQVKGITNNAVKGAQAYVTEVKNEYAKPQKVKGESKANFEQRKKAHEQRIQDEAMRRYLYDIGGARIQSFSDFMIENIFDYIQIFADLSAKRLPLHGYTKEIVCMRLFGMTGAKWNGSLIAHVERNMGKEHAGLLPAGTKDGIPVKVNGKDYVIGFDDYARNAATGGKSFIQSIGMKDIIALQLDPRYAPYVGSITIGVSDAQILAMLDSPLFRMVIPYHASGMLPQFAKLVGVDMYNDYTDYQNTTVRQYYDLNGNAVSELKNAKGETVKADTSYAFNAEIQKTKDAKTAANNYLKWCAQRHEVYDGSKLIGYATFNPKFSSSPYGTDFTRHENYYKLLEDFNTYDCITEASTVQGAVTMNFPSEQNRLTAQQMEAYKQALRDTGIFTEKDIEKYAKKANMTFKEIIDAEVGNRANYAATQAPKWESTVKEVEAKLQKDYSRNEKKILDNSSTGAENKLTEKHDRGELDDNRRIREGATEAAENSGSDRGGHSDHSGTAQETKSWKNLSTSDRKRITTIVDSHIASSRNYEEFLDLLSRMVGRTADDISVSQYKKALLQFSEKIFADVATMHPVLFENRWAMFGDSTSKLRKDILKAAQMDSGTGGVYSTQQTDNITNRHLLANAFEGIVQNSDEYKMIQDYRENIKALNELDNRLSDVNQKIRKIRFGGDGQYDPEKLQKLQGEASKLSEAIDKQDKKLLQMEASEPLRKVINRERAKASQKTREHVNEIQQNKKLRMEQTELRHKLRKAVRDLDKALNRGNKKQNVKQDMQGFVSKALDLADYIFTDHISNDELIRRGIDAELIRGEREAQLVRETEEILKKIYDEADSLTDEEFTRLDAKRKANEDKLRDLLTAQRNKRLSTPVYQLFDDLVNEYAKLANSTQDAVKAAYNVDLLDTLRSFMGDDDQKAALKNMRVADMTAKELEALLKAYKMVLVNVRDADKIHARVSAMTIGQMADRITKDFGSRKIPDKELAIAAQKLANKIGWSYEKLYYALDRIGSEAFTELFMSLADSENIVMQDVMEAEAFRDGVVKEFGYNNWAVNKEIDREFLDNTGKKFKLTLGQVMALYAYSRREGAWDHLEYGGFVFGKAALTNPRPADSYKLNKEQCEAITSLLTKEQKAYAEKMQKYLAETMGAKGNEVSMKLYGIEMFGEKNYFPIHVAGQFKSQAQESQAKAAAGFQTMSNAGFTHAQNRNAKAPIVLEGFMDVWTDHVNEMSRYHGTVPALEDIRRVMNRSTYSDSASESTSIKQQMINAYGEEAAQYFDSLYREANSGAITDKLQAVPKKLVSLFRKNSVAYSLSVLIQQPLSLTRAYAVIDKKYFGGFKGFRTAPTIAAGVAKAVSSKWNPAYADAYSEMLKYAPGVTMAKEIGGFDTATGGSIRSHLMDTNKSFFQKMRTGTHAEKAMAHLDKVDNNFFANLPNVADKLAWIEIWNACKRETVAKHKDLKPGSEEFMQAVGKRFTEVIRATQVYDSIFAKSPMLKSKNIGVQMLVSFMNEPNTTANMAESAVRDALRGDWKKGVKKASVLITSIVYTGVFKSLIYAMRDDDEDETYIEKYLESLVGSLMDDFNPFSYIPVARDIVSLVQGYDVERADMAIFADITDAIEKVYKYNHTDTTDMTEEQLADLDKKLTESQWKLAESVAAFFGIPLKNVRREINAVINTATTTAANAGLTTNKSAWDTIEETVIDSIPFMSSKKKTKQDKLYDVIMSGDKEYLGRIKATYKTDDAYHTAVRKALRENDPRVKEAAQAHINGDPSERVRIAKQIIADGFDLNDVILAINAEIDKLTPDKESSSTEKVKGYYKVEDFVRESANGDTASLGAIREDILKTAQANGKTEADAQKDFVSDIKSETKEAYLTGTLGDAKAAEILARYAELDDEEADDKVNYWAFVKAHPEYKDILNESNVKKYLDVAEPAEIPLDIYIQYINGTKGLETIYDEWGAEVKPLQDQVIEVIDSLDLTWKQKDALYLAHGYAESKIWDVPW